jgi:hypothetical protein
MVLLPAVIGPSEVVANVKEPSWFCVTTIAIVCLSMEIFGMSKMKKYRAKRLRRQANAACKFGRKAKPTHRSRSGRTGKVLSTQLKNV